MAIASWDPEEFVARQSTRGWEEQEQALNSLYPNQRKSLREWKTFVGFIEALGLSSGSGCATVCAPPAPDIRYSVESSVQYFELAEITSEEVARNASIAAKQDACHGGSISTSEPLLNIFRDKCGKCYQTDGMPVHLLLYYAVGHQYPIRYSINKSLLRDLLAPGEFVSSQFESVYVYEAWNMKVLEKLSRTH